MPTWPSRGALGAALTTMIVMSTAAALGAPPAQAAALTVSGVDVAGYQHPGYLGRCKGTDLDSIDWTAVAASGQQFAIVKATESTTCTNPYVASDVAQARAAGLVVGTYHFARPAYELKTATQQAKHYVKVVGTQRTPGTLPPVLDIESDGGLTKKRLGKWVQRWLDRVQEYTGRTPMIYSYGPFLDSKVGGLKNLAGYPLWLARYRSTPPTAAEIPGQWSSWTIWQHTSTGRVPGIEGSVDVNWFNGTRAQLLALASGSDQTAVAPDAPTDVVAQVTGSDVRLSWQAPLSDGGAPVRSYAVHVDGVLDGFTPTLGYVAMNLSPGEHTFSVRAVNDIGTGPGATSTITLPTESMGVLAAPAATTVSISAATRASGGSTRPVVVTLRRADTQQTLGSRKVTLTVTPRTGTAPAPLRLETDTSGTVTVPVTFRAHTTLTAAHGGTVRLQPTSATAFVRVVPVVTGTRSKSTLRKGKGVTFRATTDRLYAGDRAALQHKRKGVWRKHTVKQVSKKGKVTFRAFPTTTGTARFRVIVNKTSDHLAGYSSVQKVKVKKPKKAKKAKKAKKSKKK